jgi:glycosyltransferase involved in cell wall biosynthesis
MLMSSALFVTTVPITLEAFLLPYADHFRAQGWRVDAAANGATAASAIPEHFDHRYDVAWSRNPLAPHNLLGTARRIRALCAANGYDLVHVHTPVAAFVTRWALRGLRKTSGGPVVIYTAHGFHFYRGQSPLPGALLWSLERLAAPWTDYLVTVNREDFEAAKKLGGIVPERVRLIPGIGVDTARFSPDATRPKSVADIRRELEIAEDAFVLGMVAELAPVKRHALALEALARVSIPSVVLVLVGAGPLESRLRVKAAAFGVSERMRWAGYRRDIPEVLAASDAFLLCSKREGLNRSVLEAMAFGIPVIGTDTRGITDAVGPDAGWIVGHDDVAALAAAIDAAAADPAEVARRGAAARERAVVEFALPRIIDVYEELYREALASRV